MKATTIKLNTETKKMLDLIRRNDKQSYDELVLELIEDRLEAHLELEPSLKRRLLELSEQIRDKKVKTLNFEGIYKLTYG